MHSGYPIGTPGQSWGEQEKAQWLSVQQIKRSYKEEVLDKIEPLKKHYDAVQYGALPYDSERYPLWVLKSPNWSDNKPTVLITGGVHGYETSGVQGALRFAEIAPTQFDKVFNFIIAPCLSPWGYETINRWNPASVDPNRSFYPESPAPEAAMIMDYVASLKVSLLAHFDLHETTDSDNSEFRPALAARDGTVHDNWNIPDGFYTVANSKNPQADFQRAIIQSVAKVTHIAPPDEQGKIIGADVMDEGVIYYDKGSLHLCGGFTNAKYTTTTEVYPDSDSASPEICIEAQVAAIQGGLTYLQKQLG